MQLYTLHQLCALHEIGGKRMNRYRELGQYAFGELHICFPCPCSETLQLPGHRQECQAKLAVHHLLGQSLPAALQQSLVACCLMFTLFLDTFQKNVFLDTILGIFKVLFLTLTETE